MAKIKRHVSPVKSSELAVSRLQGGNPCGKLICNRETQWETQQESRAPFVRSANSDDNLGKHGDRDKTCQLQKPLLAQTVQRWRQFSISWHPYPATTSPGSDSTKQREPSSSLGSCHVNRSEKLVEKICNTM